MSDDLLAPFGLDAPPATTGGNHDLEQIRHFLEFANQMATLHTGFMIALFGTGLLALMLAPERHRLAGQRLGRNGVRAFLLGVGAFVLLGVGFGALLRAGIHPGRLSLMTLATIAAAIGLSVCARILGERMLPERGPLAQTATGLMALVLPLASLPGWMVLLIAAPLGLGAWLLPMRAENDAIV